MQYRKQPSTRRRNLGTKVTWAGPCEGGEQWSPEPAPPAFVGPHPADADQSAEPFDDPPLAPDHLEEDLVRIETDLMDQKSQVWTLNRNLGGLDQRLGDLEHTRSEGAGGTLRQRIRAALAAIGNVFSPPPETDAGDSPAWPPGMPVRHPPLVPFGERNLGKRIIAVTAFCLSDGALAKVLDTVESYCAKRDALPLVLTDSVRFEMFRQRAMAFEYFPSESLRNRLAPDLEWPLYFRRRLSLLRRKWGPAGLVSFGSPGPVAELGAMLVGDDERAAERRR